MSKRYNTPHPERSKSTYGQKIRGMGADKYGHYENGRQQAVDVIAGHVSIQTEEKSEK